MNRMKIIITATLLITISACGEERNSAATETSAPVASAEKDAPMEVQAAIGEEKQQAYKNKVNTKMRSVRKNNLVRDYGISEEQANCLVENVSASQLNEAQTDPVAQGKIKECDVDASIIK